jgi:alkylation response protein AidB-like acyl-CoA dehydrogenase
VQDYEHPPARDIAEAVDTAREAGMFGINLPLDWGGVGLGAQELAGILEEISLVDAGMAGILFTHAAALEVIAAASVSGAENCRTAYRLASMPGGAPLAFQSFAAPEELDLPGADGGEEVRLTGACPILALGGLARHAVIAGARKGSDGFSWYLVDLSDEGVTKSAPLITHGLQACRAVDVVLEDAPALLLGAEGEGAAYFRKTLLRMSLPAAAIALGVMRGCFREAFEYSLQRRQGDKRIVEWSGVRMKLAEIAVQIEAARSCIAGVADPHEGGLPALAAVVHIDAMACAAATEGVQLLGGNGYMKDYGQEKRMRDARQAMSLLGMGGLKKLRCIDMIMEEAGI